MTQGTWVIMNVAGGLALGAILDYFWMSGETLIILSAMLILDRIFWIVDAYMQNTLQSKVMVNGLIKKLTRWCFPFIVIAVLRWAGFGEVDLISTAMLSILIVAEWYSIVGHIYSINYKETLPEIDALKSLFQWIWKLFKGKIDDIDKK
jgi:phage-related holin